MLSLKTNKIKKNPLKPGKKTLVMVVDDEPSNLEGICGLLEDYYDLITADGGEAAIQALETAPDVKVIVSDQKMPGMSGVEFLTKLKEMNHPAIRLILTGFADINSIISGLNQAGIFSYLTKPVDANELRGKVEKAIQKYDVAQNNQRLVQAIEKVQDENVVLKEKLVKYSQSGNEEENDAILGTADYVGILSCDIRGFTRYSLNRSASEVITVLQRIFRFLHENIYDHGGIVDKHMGDGMLAIFGLKGDSSVDRGIACVQKIVQLYPDFYKTLSLPEDVDLKLGVGFAAGAISVTKLSVDDREEVSYLGDSMALAGSLQELSRLPLKFDDAREVFGDYENAMAVISHEFIENFPEFRPITLAGKSRMHAFPDIASVGVLQS